VASDDSWSTRNSHDLACAFGCELPLLSAGCAPLDSQHPPHNTKYNNTYRALFAFE